MAVAISEDGGLSWGPLRVALRWEYHFIDKPSISAFGSTVVIAAVAPYNNRLLLVTSKDAGESWSSAHFYDFDELQTIQNPIVKLVGARTGYLMYMTKANDQHSDVRVLRIGAPKLAPASWQATRIFAEDDLVHATPMPAANGRTWRDVVPARFDVGPGRHLYFTYARKNGGGTSQIWLADCVDSPPGSCAMDPGGSVVGWNVRLFAAYNKGQSQYQPNVSAWKGPAEGPTWDSVALTWYQESPPEAGAISAVGVVSDDGGATWSVHYNLHPDDPSWVPCPTRTGGYYGDYFDTAILPRRYGVDELPWVVTAFATSSFCLDVGEVTYDHHVQATVW